MSIRFLNCASMSPWWPRWHVGAVCLLVDTDQGPVLVDTGLGVHDHESPSGLMQFFRPVFGIPDLPEEPAVRQLARRGIDPQQIRHIILTHVHFDHAGGLPDFPWAQVHVHCRELDALRRPKKWIERFAYDHADFAHGPRWMPYEKADGKWFDFDAISLPFSPRMHLIPLFGHTSGHCGVVIEDGAGWLFQAGDALPLNAQFNITPWWLNQLILGPHTPRLAAFAAAHPEVRMLAGHAWSSFFSDPAESLYP